MAFFIFLKRLKMISGLAQALFAVLDDFHRTAADARHAVDAAAAPNRPAVFNRDVVGWAGPGTLAAHCSWNSAPAETPLELSKCLSCV